MKRELAIGRTEQKANLKRILRAPAAINPILVQAPCVRPFQQHDFNGFFKTENYLSVEKFPAISFKSSSYKFDGNKMASITGDLTIKGITKPVTLNVSSFNCAPHPFAEKEACGANASATIKRSEFNAGKYAPAVSDEVTLNIAVEAIKE